MELADRVFVRYRQKVLYIESAQNKNTIYCVLELDISTEVRIILHAG